MAKTHPWQSICRNYQDNSLAKNAHGAFVAAMLLAGIIGCGRNDASSAGDGSTATGGISAHAAPKEIDSKAPVVQIETSLGAITVQLDGVLAPGTVRNFLNYAEDGFYDNTLVHFVDAGKMILAGGYTTDRSQKPAHSSIRNEAHNGLKNVRGTIAMAREQSLIDSATSQFFINLADAPQRDYQGDSADKYGYCVFGQVIEGLDIADKISQSPTTNQDGDLAQTPEPSVVIKSVRVVR